MSAPLKKPRLPRIDRGENQERASAMIRAGGTEDNAHLWVVSYADLLMVLLCFFVLFYSTNKPQRDSVIHRILVTTNGNGNGSGTSGTHKEVSKNPGASITDSVATKLLDLQLKTSQDGETLTIELPDDSYAKGGTALMAAQEELLSKILLRLKPFSEEIDLVFIGHTDSSPIQRIKTRRIADNLDLSSERAKQAMIRASGMGFSVDHLRIEGDASTRRQSRTLSITVLGREAHP